MRIVCWQTILMKYHDLFFRKFGKMVKNLLSAAVMIGALRVKLAGFQVFFYEFTEWKTVDPEQQAD